MYKKKYLGYELLSLGSSQRRAKTNERQTSTQKRMVQRDSFKIFLSMHKCGVKRKKNVEWMKKVILGTEIKK